MNSLFANELRPFPTDLAQIQVRIERIDPLKYGKTRNFVNGKVTYLSPYISRGVISTRQLLNAVLARGYAPVKIEKFIQELAWRDYWQQIWIAKKDDINKDLKSAQADVEHKGIPRAIVEASTGIEAIDRSIKDFYDTGYLHNHLRMYIASMACNVARCHWKIPAQWMYFHLLDADWASNALSWQWIAGTNSKKKYYANQGNINRYCFSSQKGTFLDVSYEDFKHLEIPAELREQLIPRLSTTLPQTTACVINAALPSLIYNFYNLDPNWKKDIEANRILLLEPSHFKKYPIADESLKFILELSKNIKGIQIYVGEFEELLNGHEIGEVYYKEHPLNSHYSGIEEQRDWMFSLSGYFPSFFAYWKRCKKFL